MKKITFLILILGTTLFNALAQKPNWLDGRSRSAQYPENQYFTGYATERNSANKAHEDVLDNLKSVARTDLIQSIQVAIKSVTNMDLESKNGKSSAYLKQVSTSLSQANIVGLKYETYYDTKTKEAFAFCYASKSEVISYYKNTIAIKIKTIKDKIEIAKKSTDSGDKQNALKSYFECMPIFREIEEAQGLLVAMGSSDENSLAVDESKQLKIEVNKGIFALYSGKSLSLGDVAFFIAYSLKMQTGELQDQIILDKFLYQDTELASAFTSQFGPSLEQCLIKQNYKLVKTKATSLVSGTYWEDGENIKIIAILRNTDNGKAIASAEALLSKSWLKSNNIDYTPENLDKVNKLNKIVITATPLNIKTKQNQVLTSPIVIKLVEKDNSGNEKPLANAPISFSYSGGGKIMTSTQLTNSEGIIKFSDKLQTSERKIKLTAALNLIDYLATDSSSNFYKKTTKMYSTPKVEINAELSGAAIFFDVNELKFGSKMTVTMIEPKLKEALSSKGFEFVSSSSKADLIIKIQADARSGSSVEGLCMSFVDANVSITEISSGSEIFKNAYTNMKGGGTDFDMAAVKAYSSAARKITDEIVKLLVK